MRSGWYSFGAPLRAVADGTVSKAVASHADDRSFDPQRQPQGPERAFRGLTIRLSPVQSLKFDQALAHG